MEESVAKCYRISAALLQVDPDEPHLHRKSHVKYLKRGLFQKLPASAESLDSSRGWIVYWITHSLSLLEPDGELSVEQRNSITASLSRYQNESGGFGGGPQQISHMAATYAVVNALFTVNPETAVQVIDKTSMHKFLMSLKQADGSYLMHEDGETDVRGVYCALSVAYLTGILDDDLTGGCVEWITSCQTYEGGFGGSPGAEAHGGYTFCAVAALAILKSLDKCDMKSLLRFVTNRQQSFEGGFAGRTNKLVDGCYSFWVGGIFPILHTFLSSQGMASFRSRSFPHTFCIFAGMQLPANKWLFNQEALRDYILCCCQDTSGGLLDKPDKRRDYYHTCYALSGLSIAQHTFCSPASTTVSHDGENEVTLIHPIFNVHLHAIESIKERKF